MPELEEVFRVATQKVRRDPGAMDRQLGKQRRAARNRKLGALAVVAVVMAGAGAAVAVLGGNSNGTPASVGPSASPSQVVFPTEPVTSSMIDLDTGAVTPLPDVLAGADAYAVSPDHAQVAFTSSNALYVGNIDGTNIRQVSPTGVDAYGPQWSPDGTKLVYQQRDATTIKFGNLFVLDVATGAETRITDLDQSQRYGWWFLDPSFAPDGQHVLYQLPTGDQRNAVWNLWTAPITGGHASIVQPNAGWGALRAGGILNLAFVTHVSPSTFHGAELMLGSTDRRGIYLHPLATGSIVAPQWSPDGSRIAFEQGGFVDVVNLAGEVTKVVRGSNPEWFDDHTLILGG